MKSTIDKAGRVVIPAPLREKAGLRPGTELEIRLDESGIRLLRAVPGPKIVRTGGRLVARASVPPAERHVVDVAALIQEERDRWP